MSSVWHVYKFGGTSLGTAGRLPRVLDLIAAAPRPLEVVVSALGDSTDWLILSARSAAEGELTQARHELGRVRELAVKCARPLLTPHSLRAFKADLADVLTPVERLLSGIELTREASPRSLDAVISAGERISAALVSRALRERNVPGLAVDARDFLVTDAVHGNAAVDSAATAKKFSPFPAQWSGHIPIVTGFIARTRDGHTTTLGRNGSDYTATLLASLLRAESVTVWTDVLGVMTADPAFVRDATPVDRLSYDEALELAYFGTRMFHSRTIIPLRECGAALVIRSTTQPHAPGTRIDAQGHTDADRPTCVTSLEQLSLLGVQSRRTGLGRPIASRILADLDSAGVRVWLTTESTLGQTFSVVVPLPDEERARAILQKSLASDLLTGDLSLGPVLSPVSLVTLVAASMAQKPNVSGRMLDAIGRGGIRIRALTQGASARSISCVVDADDTANAVRAVHSAFNLTPAEVNVLLFGKGIVGGRLLRQLDSQGATRRSAPDVPVRLVGLADRRGGVFDADGFAPATASAQLDAALAHARGSDVFALLPALARLPNPVFVDCTGASGMEKIYTAAFALGINVVSAKNKPHGPSAPPHSPPSAANTAPTSAKPPSVSRSRSSRR